MQKIKKTLDIIRKKPHYLGVGVSVILGGYIFYKILKQRINKSENEEENHIEENQEDILQKDEWYNNIDPSSLSNLNDFTTLHYDIDYFIEFNKKKLAGKINYTFESKASDLKKIILDVKCLLIYEVTNEQDQVLKYHIQSNPKYKEDLGDQLVITLDKTYQQSDQFTIRIFFDTFNPDNRPTAINWLNPEQTMGKKYPFLFTQCEPIFARTLFPCQDSPSVKATFNATLRTNNKISAYCSGQLTQVFDSDFEKVYLFEQTIPIPAYLFALLAGDLKQNKISERCYVIAEPSFIDQCCSELDEMETQLNAIEDYLTPYKWKEYKIAILPPSFPYGGMENPLLTFASPTIIVGDKSQTQVVIHEMVHSWYQELVNAVRGFGSKHEYTKLQPNLKHNNPDDAFSQVPYVKGCQFLMYLERQLGINGEQIFQEFLKRYFIQFEQQSIDYEEFMIFYRSFLKERLDQQQFQQYFDTLKLQEWLYEPGLPIETSSFESSKLNQMNDLLNQFIKNPLIIIQDPLKFHNLENDLKPLFLNGILQNKQKIKSFNNVISQMETQLQMNANYLHKYEIGVKWMLLAISASHQKTIEQVEQIVGSVGRMKYLRPIYKALIQNGYKNLAQKIFQKNKLFYHTIAAKMIGKDIL
ncbi:Armadillo-type fold [Pseudocohnilembus persalinus]|uniref:Armadillo-type fold n=1 Tax=Pseudocohnilembus persalinus TaxID=266149 RepID=A0A0V0QES4_PSEPJ|nr:Armadillo-type fold [Pseudocohnilembus persalinus]|eukprot:KRX00695.1 Armadillo-type fold [Pseudocohnilembus persalinus]